MAEQVKKAGRPKSAVKAAPRRAKKSAHGMITIEAVRGGVTAAAGFKAAGMRAGIKTGRATDLGLIVSDRPAVAAGAFTTNALRAASVDWCNDTLPNKGLRAIICNSGCANACTGSQGAHDNAHMASLVSGALKIKTSKMVLTASTGVIGKSLPIRRIRNAMPKLMPLLSDRPSGASAFAQAILTTDRVKKESAVRVSCYGQSFTIGGAAKGSGMIHPNMATMLCFITTDALIETNLLNLIVKRVADRTFNCLTVDGDTSTNDMMLVMANGASGAAIKRFGSLTMKASVPGEPSDIVEAFEEGLFTVCSDLCKKIAADGEGATKRVEVNVINARTDWEAKLAAKAVANSLLTKCALSGNDPNWGRIACAVGYSNAKLSKKLMTIDLCGVRVFENAEPMAFNADKLQALLKKKSVKICIDLGVGKSSATMHTCDISPDYVKINSDYRT